MLTLKVEVPEARDRTAFSVLRDGLRTLATGPAVASATSTVAAQHANPECDPLRLCGHPPLGRYRLLHHEPTGAWQSAHYGAHVLLFEPQSGPALDAEAFGRLGLLVYGGPPGRRTQGGLRVDNDLLQILAAHLSTAEDMALDLVESRPRAWWQFWKAPLPPSRPLSGDALNPPMPPNDELTLLEALLQKSVRPARPPATDSDDTYDRDSRSDTSSTGSSSARFEGGGGSSGGGGASGQWREGSARGPGVDAAGRIMGAAAVLGAVAATAALASDAHSDGSGEAESSSGASSDSTSDTTTSY